MLSYNALQWLFKCYVVFFFKQILQNFKVEFNGEMGFVTRLVNVPDKPLRFTFIDL